MTSTPDVNPADLPHQVEESDRISMLGAFRVIGLLVIVCALLQLVCSFIPFRLDDPIWTLNNSPKWNGVASIFLVGAVCFFLPGPTSARFGTQPLRLTIRFLLVFLALSYLLLAAALIRATDTRISQLNAGQTALFEERDRMFSKILTMVKGYSTKEELANLLPANAFNVGDVEKQSVEEYRNRVVQILIELNGSSVESIQLEADQNAFETTIIYLRKILRSSVFSLAFILLALSAPRGFPPPVPIHEQPA